MIIGSSSISLLGLRLILSSDRVVQRETGADTVQVVNTVSRCTDQLANTNDVHAGLLLSVGVLDKSDLRVSLEALNLRKLDKVIDPLALVL